MYSVMLLLHVGTVTHVRRFYVTKNHHKKVWIGTRNFVLTILKMSHIPTLQTSRDQVCVLFFSLCFFTQLHVRVLVCIATSLLRTIAQSFVSIHLLLPMFHLTFFPAVKSSVTSFAWSEFVLWWIMWSVAGCTFKGFWNERPCCSSFEFVKHLESLDSTLFSLLC